MAEVELGFPRVWIEYPDPTTPGLVIRADLTWLTSRWTCIFGRGCQGIYSWSPDTGCCTLGAHFADADDIARGAKSVKRLDASIWEKMPAGKVRAKDWREKDDEGAHKTRVVGDGCVFHNSADFAGGYGCALHFLAEREDISFVATKPDVCWQLPVRRTYRETERGDGTKYLEVSIGEYDRLGWGPGGHDLDWYCSSNTDAHIGNEPVFISNAAELIELIGQPAYDVLAHHCEAHLNAGPTPMHPASSAGSS